MSSKVELAQIIGSSGTDHQKSLEIQATTISIHNQNICLLIKPWWRSIINIESQLGDQ